MIGLCFEERVLEVFLNYHRMFRNYWSLFLIAGFIILVDQLSKLYVRANFIEGVTMWAPWDWMLPYARIVHITNTGVAFGMFQGLGYIFAFLAVIVSGAIIYYYRRVPVEDWTLRFAMCLQLGGAVGNLIDRLTNNGYVTDFISVGNFPVFNVADASISVGVAVLILGVWLQERRQKHEEASKKLESSLLERSAVESDCSSQDSKSSEA
jgi:signal peptidase II